MHAQAAREIERILSCAHVGDALPRNVISSAVRRRSDRDRQAALNRNTALESHQFHRDLALIVIHGDDSVVVTIFCTHEDRVSRERPIDCNSTRLRQRNTGRDDVYFLRAIVTAIAIMRIESTYGHTRRSFA